MKLAPVSSLLLCALPLLTACGSAVGESADTAESKVGVASEALVTVTPAPLAGGDYGSMVIRADETVVAFGYDIHGQLGDGGTSDQKSPQPVPGLTKIKAVSAGLTNYSMAVDGEGALYSWGSNIWGQLGLGMPGNGDVSAPTKVTFPAGVLIKAVAAANIHPIALGDDGTVWSWGFNGEGQLGNGSFGGNTTSPSKVQVRLSTGGLTPLTGVKAIAGGAGHGLALMEDKTVWSWGSNSHGQLGDGTIDDENTAHVIAGLANIKAIAAGRHHSLALTEDGAVFAWGENERGQLGDESIVERCAPVSVHGLSGVIIKALAASFESSFALKDDGTLVAWGLNGNGQLGDESTTERHAPVPVHGLTGITEIAAGDHHALARNGAGQVFTWGLDNHGQLGDGDSVDTGLPGPISLPCAAACAPLDQCHVAGVCASTGVCTNPDKGNGAPCNDGNACTQVDTCQAGACTGASPVVCVAADPCTPAGLCDPGTGSCSLLLCQ